MVSGDEGGVREPEMAVGCRGGCARRRRAERWWSWRSWWWWTKDNSTTGLGWELGLSHVWQRLAWPLAGSWTDGESASPPQKARTLTRLL